MESYKSHLKKISVLVFACLVPISTAHSQIDVDSIQIPPRLKNSSKAERDQYQVESAIAAASKLSHKQNKNVTVFFSSGELVQKPIYDGQQRIVEYQREFKHREYRLIRPLLVENGVVLAGRGYGRREAQLVWEKCESNSALIVFRSGFGGGLRNIVIRTNQLKSARNVTAIFMHSQSSAVFENFAIYMTTLGENSNGIVVGRNKTNTESVLVQNFNISASRPVIIMSGDNLVFSNFDCLCSSPTTEDAISAVFQNWNGSVPDNWTIGPGSGQKGDHAISFTGSKNRTGDSLTISGFRWEQGTGKGPAWVFDIERRGKSGKRVHTIENLVMINCRNGRRDKSYVSRKVPKGSIMKTNIIGGYMPGKVDESDE